MQKRAVSLALALAVALTAASPGLARDKRRHNNDNHAAAVVVGGLLAAAALAAASQDHRHESHRYYPNVRGQRSMAPFSPAPLVTCYPAERACYNVEGVFAGKWTRRIFGG